MLHLRQDWRTVLGGTVAADLVAQVQGDALRNTVAGRLIAASLDLLVATWPREREHPLEVRSLSNTRWQIGALHYVYLASNDDHVLDECIRLAGQATMTVIVARQHEALKRQLLAATLRDRTPNTWSFGTFISWRTTSANMDQDWPRGQATLELIAAYNRRTIATEGGDSMTVDIRRELR